MTLLEWFALLFFAACCSGAAYLIAVLFDAAWFAFTDFVLGLLDKQRNK